MKRWHRRGALLWLLGLLACAATPKPKPADVPALPKPPEEPFSWVPEQSTSMGRAALSELRKSRFWPQLWAELERQPFLASWVDPSKVTRATFGATGHSRADLSYVAALEGDFSPTELQALAARDQVVAEQRGLLTIYRRPEDVWTQISPKLIVTCTSDRLDALVARASAGPGTASKESPLYRALGSRVSLDESDLSFIAEDPDGSGRAELVRRAERLGLDALVRDSQRLGGALDVGADYRVVGVSETADDAHAEAQLAEARRTLDRLSNHFIVRLLGLASIATKLQATRDGSYVLVRGTIPEAELQSALERVQGAAALSGSLGL